MRGLIKDGDVWAHIPVKDPSIYQVQFLFEQTALTKSTYRTYSKHIEIFKDYISRDRKPRTILREDVQKFKEWLTLTRGYNPGSVGGICRTCRTFFTWCEYYGITDPYTNPFAPLPQNFKYVTGDRK